ncbi:MAG: hypothetical protein ACRDQI_19175 [Pseudonocardiaceae bacterium]
MGYLALTHIERGMVVDGQHVAAAAFLPGPGVATRAADPAGPLDGSGRAALVG